MTNTLQTNTFTGGMNLDVDVTMIPNNQYRYAENVRVITDTAGTTGVLQNVQDTRMVEGGDFISSGEKVLTTTTIDKYGIILTVNGDKICKIYRVENYDNPPLVDSVIVKGKLGYTKDSQVKILANYESATVIKIYIACPDQVIKTLNIMDGRYMQTPQGNPLLDSDGNLKNVNLLDIQMSTLLNAPEVISLGGGSLTTGIVQYAYQLFNARGSATNFSPVSNAIHLTNSDVSGGQKNYMGNNKDVNSGKSVNFKVKLNDIPEGLFDNIRLIRIKYNDYTEDPVIEVFQENEITTSTNEYTFNDTGGTAINTITIEEFNKIQESTFTAGTIEAKNNILFAANIKESTWKPEYDARSYRFTANNRLILNGSSQDQNIDVLVSNTNLTTTLSSIPQSHDCINPFNSQDPNFNNRDVCKYQFGTGKLGGTGLNIDYEFVTTDITLDDNFTNTLTITTPVSTSNQIRIDRLDGSTLETISLGPSGINRFKNYADPYFASKYKGYHRDEVYRFGIVFFNDRNVATPVYWIGDIKFPHCWEACPWYVQDLTLYGKAIGINFKIKNYPDGAKAYQIVRCKRTKEDRTILTQALLSGTVSYPYHSVRNADYDIASENTRRPYTFLGNSWQKIGQIPSSILSGVNYQWLVNERVDNYISTLISPEIDANQDDMAKSIKGCRADMCLKLDPRTNYKAVLPSIYQATAYGYYVRSNRTQVVDDGIAITNEYTTQSGQTGSITSSSLESTNDIFIVADGAEYTGITNVIGKRYIAHYTGFNTTRGKFDINESVSPVIMENFSWPDAASKHSSISGRTYLNASVSHNGRQDNEEVYNKTGYFGNCVVVTRDNNNIGVQQNINIDRAGEEPMTPRVSGVIADLIREFNYTQFTTPIVNIKTDNIPYSGNTYSARSNSTYVSTYTYHNVSDNSVTVFGGDTYLGVLDHKTVMYIPQFWGGTESPDINCGVSVSDYIPFETTINLALLYGSSASRMSSDDLDYVDPYLSLTIAGASYGGHTQSKPYFAYNDAYSRQPDAQLYVTDSNYSISNLQSGNRIRYSGTKTANEISDSWTSFKVADYLDVDSSHGDITNLKQFNNQLLFWQKDAVGVASVNDRSLITDNNQAPLVLGTGGVLDRYDYLTTSNGSDKSNDKSIVGTPNGLYWYDDSKNEICSYGNGIQKLSKVKSVQSWLNTDKQKAKVSIYDPKFNEVQIGFEDKVLTYDEQIQQFSSFRTFNPDDYLSFPDKLLYIKDQIIKENADFPLNEMKSRLQFVVNKDPLLTKTFDNVFFSGEFKDVRKMIQAIKFTTKTQESTIFKDNTEINNPIEQREDTFRFAVGREKNPVDDMSLPSRMKGKYMICDYIFNCNDQHDFKLPNMNTTYRYSMV